MIAGTLAIYTDPLDEPLETWSERGRYPTLVVSGSQETHGDATAQHGQVAGRVETTETDVLVYEDQDGDTRIETDRIDGIETIATDWYADPTDSGVILAESVADPDAEYPFPFDVFAGIADSRVQRQQLDVETLHDDWQDADGLSDVWMGAGDGQVGTRIGYHGAARDVDPTIGLGFKRAWGGTTIKGVAYASGYVALYSARHPADGLQFVADEILPYAESWDPEQHQDQTDFDDFGGGA
ncbi:MAG: hypothetical protein ACOCUA_02955 [archaeon]